MSSIFQQTFCNVPWFECHIYYNGDFGICSHEWHKPNGSDKGSIEKSHYNIANMSISEWFNSDLMRSNRKNFLTTNCKLSMCEKCYRIEDSSGHGNRHRHLQNSAIFPTVDFMESYKQSPHHNSFEMARAEGYTNTLPVYFHIDFGNYCNLACKMCYAPASSTIAKQEVLWGIDESKKYIGNDWTKDPLVYQRFLSDMISMPKHSKIHFMGGEALITKRFAQFVDYCLENDRSDFRLSVVTNGMIYNNELIEKLSKFHRLDIEVSIETMDRRNEYVRQGTVNQTVFKNIERYNSWTNHTNINLCLRSVPNILTIGTYYKLLQYCLDNNIVIQSNLVREPEYFEIRHLPSEVKQQYHQEYVKFASKNNLQIDDNLATYKSRHNDEVDRIVAWHTKQALSLLQQPCTEKSADLLQQLVQHCTRWDQVYGYNIYNVYPEFVDVI